MSGHQVAEDTAPGPEPALPARLRDITDRVDISPPGARAVIDLDQPSILDLPFGQGRMHNRAFPCQLAASTDRQAIGAFVESLRTLSPKTFSAYTRELDLFLRWALFVRGKSISDLMYEDMAQYRDFLLDPPASWISKRGTWHRTHPNWRPFRGPRTATNVAYSMTILQAMLQWLQNKGWLAANVIRGNRWTRRADTADEKTPKYLPPEARQMIARWLAHEHQENLARAQSGGDAVSTMEVAQVIAYRRRQLERYEHIFVMAYTLLLRRTDFEVTTMGSFYPDEEKVGRWKWSSVRKRGKTTRLVASAAAIAQLNRYRASFGLAPLPALVPADSTLPIVLNLAGTAGIGSDRVYELFSDMFEGAADYAESLGHEPGLGAIAQCLREATPHWVRHTAITDLRRSGVAGHVARDLAGHDDEATTNTYTHTGATDQEVALECLGTGLPDIAQGSAGIDSRLAAATRPTPARPAPPAPATGGSSPAGRAGR